MRVTVRQKFKLKRVGLAVPQVERREYGNQKTRQLMAD